MKRRTQGFTLIELMLAAGIGLGLFGLLGFSIAAGGQEADKIATETRLRQERMQAERMLRQDIASTEPYFLYLASPNDMSDNPAVKAGLDAKDWRWETGARVTLPLHDWQLGNASNYDLKTDDRMVVYEIDDGDLIRRQGGESARVLSGVSEIEASFDLCSRKVEVTVRDGQDRTRLALTAATQARMKVPHLKSAVPYNPDYFNDKTATVNYSWTIRADHGGATSRPSDELLDHAGWVRWFAFDLICAESVTWVGMANDMVELSHHASEPSIDLDRDANSVTLRAYYDCQRIQKKQNVVFYCLSTDSMIEELPFKYDRTSKVRMSKQTEAHDAQLGTDRRIVRIERPRYQGLGWIEQRNPTLREMTFWCGAYDPSDPMLSRGQAMESLFEAFNSFGNPDFGPRPEEPTEPNIWDYISYSNGTYIFDEPGLLTAEANYNAQLDRINAYDARVAAFERQRKLISACEAVSEDYYVKGERSTLMRFNHFGSNPTESPWRPPPFDEATVWNTTLGNQTDNPIDDWSMSLSSTGVTVDVSDYPTHGRKACSTCQSKRDADRVVSHVLPYLRAERPTQSTLVEDNETWRRLNTNFVARDAHCALNVTFEEVVGSAPTYTKEFAEEHFEEVLTGWRDNGECESP